MTPDQDIDRVLDRWFTEGPTRMPTRFLDDTLDRIDREPRRRFAGVRTMWPAMDAGRRIAATAIAFAIVAAIGGGLVLRPNSAGDQRSAVPTSLQAEWHAIVARRVPGPQPGGLPTFDEMVIDPTTLTIWDKTDDVSSISLVAPDRLEARMLSMGKYWHCRVGDLGTYAFVLSSRAAILTLTPVSDACAERATFLAGDWSRTDLGNLEPGRYTAALFRPNDGGVGGGGLAYTVPGGWVGTEMRAGLFALGRPSVSDSAAIRLMANAYPSDQGAPCSENRGAVGVGKSAAAKAAWLTTIPGLVVSPPTPITVGGLSGLAVDVSIVPGWTTTCSAGLHTFSYDGSDNGGWSNRLVLKGSGMARYFLLDRRDGSSLVIAVEAPGADWNAFLADAMQVLDSFEFTR